MGSVEAFVVANPWLHTAASVALVVLGCLLGLQWGQGRRLRRRLAGMQRELDASRQRDALTGMLRREEFELALALAAQRADEAQQPLALLYINLDGFGSVNEIHGHAEGDALLLAAAERLGTAIQQHLAARVAGDEFVVLCEGDLAQGRALAQRLLAVLSRPFEVQGQPLTLGASIGVASYPEHGAHSRLLVHSGLAMRAAKASGGGALAVYDRAMDIDHRGQAQLRQDLRLAIERRQFELVFQPKIDACTLQVTAAEALLRWNHPQRGVVSPAMFIPLAERHGLIVEIGQWVIDEACRQAASWRDKGLRMRVAVNLSGVQLRHEDLVSRIERALARHGLRPERFTCEITESVAMEDTAATQRAFDGLRRAGLHVSIDDFGTGYSSLASLRKLPAAELKIDRDFVADLEHSQDARSITQAIVQMAHSLGLRVVAEGVETAGQRDLLVAMGVDELQGFLFSRPLSAMALGMWAQDDRPEQRIGFRDSLFEATAPGALG